jgi:hypothetical protein
VTKYPYRLWIVVLILGWTFDYLFWKKAIGVNYALFTCLTLIVGLGLLVAGKLQPAGKGLWLLLPFAFFTATTFLRQEPLTKFLAFTFSLFPLGLLATSYIGGRWMQYGWLDYFENFFQLVGSMFVRPIVFNEQIHKEQLESGKPGGKLPYLALLRGLLIALPIVFCFGSLLASGDVVFEQKLADIFEAEKFVENITRLVLIVSCAYLLAGVFLHAAGRSGNEKLVGEGKPVFRPFLGFYESVVVLACVNLLFLAFVIVQFKYFFGGQTNIGVEGYTYSQYARRGFNELVMVAFFSLLLVIGSSTFTRREGQQQRRVFSGMNVALVGLVLVILVSAFQRILLAIDWHGFSRLRLYPSVFLIWVGILFVAIVVLEIFQRERSFAFATVLASIGFAFSLTLLNVDDATVRYNIPRVLQGKNLNVTHLASLSPDAIPALVEAFHSSEYFETMHEGIGAILACYLYSERVPLVMDMDWRSFNLSRWRAHQAIREVRIELVGYRFRGNKWSVQTVRTPNNKLYNCTEYLEYH